MSGIIFIVDAIVRFESVVREERGDDLNGDDSGIGGCCGQ